MDVAQKTAIKGIDITTYLVKDVERATKFYTEAMGMKVTMDYRGQGAEFTFGDGTTFGIWKMEDGSWHPSGGVMFGVDDLSAAVDHSNRAESNFKRKTIRPSWKILYAGWRLQRIVRAITSCSTNASRN